LAVEHGLAWGVVDDMTALVIEIKLQEDYGLPIDGTLEEKKIRLWEASQPIYPMPKLIPNTARQIVFSAVLDEDDEPRPQGTLRYALLQRLEALGYRDEDTANQTIDIQLENLVRFYGYTIVKNDDVIIVARRKLRP
jgi:hypothetical protein